MLSRSWDIMEDTMTDADISNNDHASHMRDAC